MYTSIQLTRGNDEMTKEEQGIVNLAHLHGNLVLSCVVLCCLVLSCVVLSCLVLSCLVLSCLVIAVRQANVFLPRNMQREKQHWKMGFIFFS